MAADVRAARAPFPETQPGHGHQRPEKSDGPALTAPAASREGILPFVFVGLTATTGIVDAVSYLALGHVFTANMTGNVVFLGFAIARAKDLSVARSSTAL